MEPVRTIPDVIPSKIRTLAPQIIRWTAENFSDSWQFTEEQLRILYRWYQIDDNGRWIHDAGTIRRMKGAGKSPFAAALALIELLAPCRFGGWDEHGYPIAVRPDEAWVQVFSTSSDQNKNIMLSVHSLLNPAAMERYQVDPGQERYHAYVDGRFCILEAKPASYRAAEGGRPSFAICDETWHWVDTNHGPLVWSTIGGNIAKIDGSRTMQLTNAPVIGQDSVAELTWVAWQKQQDNPDADEGLGRQYYDSIEAPPNVNLDDVDELKEAIRVAAGGAHWVNPTNIVKQVRASATPRDEVLRKYLNIVTAADDALVDPAAWAACETNDRLQAGDRIVLGLDGGERDDSTALIAMRVSDRLAHVVGLWERPDGPAADGWEIDKQEVSDRVAWTYANYDVAAFLSDVAHWETYVNEWSETYGPRLDIKPSAKSHVGYDMRVNQREITDANAALVGSINTGTLRHEGHYGLGRHVRNARRRYNNHGISFGKESRHSRHKVDAYAALLLCHIGRTRLVEAGKAKRPINPRIGGSAWVT
ncbi:hypothetical protein [Haloglycomyces albus]|uniref:hypothetical protein n=1 Tax=Haloglycomyces albus TaxID=526067 RepID=UPI00046CE151|nr:hypothetical protein [Haloglycomyces albus]